MKILLPIAGDDVSDHFHNLYHRLLKDKEPIMTTFNGVSVILFMDDSGLEHSRKPKEPYRDSIDINAVKVSYARDIEDADPSGYTTVKKFYDELKIKDKKNRDKVNKITALVSNWEYSDSPQQIKNKIKKILEE